MRGAGSGIRLGIRGFTHVSSILIVEDDPDIANLIAHYLEKAGHAVTRLTSGTQVVGQLRAAPADRGAQRDDRDVGPSHRAKLAFRP